MIRYAIEDNGNNGLYLLDPTVVHEENLLLFDSIEDADTYLWERDALIAMTMKVVPMEVSL